jgi:hypothetical protein
MKDYRKTENKVFIKAYNNWFDILKQDGNYALIKFNEKQIVYNIIGLELILTQQKNITIT